MAKPEVRYTSPLTMCNTSSNPAAKSPLLQVVIRATEIAVPVSTQYFSQLQPDELPEICYLMADTANALFNAA